MDHFSLTLEDYPGMGFSLVWWGNCWNLWGWDRMGCLIQKLCFPLPSFAREPQVSSENRGEDADLPNQAIRWQASRPKSSCHVSAAGHPHADPMWGHEGSGTDLRTQVNTLTFKPSLLCEFAYTHIYPSIILPHCLGTFTFFHRVLGGLGILEQSF